MVRVETIQVDGYNVENLKFVLRTWSWGKDQEVIEECTDYDPISKRLKLSGRKYNERMQELCIIDWDLKGKVRKDEKDSWIEYDQNGEKIPITLENIKALDPRIGRTILAKLIEMNTLTKEDKAFLPK